MLDNSLQEKESNKKFEIEENHAENHTLVKMMNEIEANVEPNLSTIQENQNSSINSSTLTNINNELKDNILENGKKEENESETREKIGIYINSHFNPNFKDNNNICEKCRINSNNFFCENCSINLCNICSENCNKEHKNKLIKLTLDKMEFYKSEIERIIAENFSEPKKKDENGEKEIFDKNKIIDLPIIKLEYTNEIKLIKLIIYYNYNNYYYYKNIENCYKYLKRKYDIDDQILIEYKIEKNENIIKYLDETFLNIIKENVSQYLKIKNIH